jgi:hypothetical protein
MDFVTVAVKKTPSNLSSHFCAAVAEKNLVKEKIMQEKPWTQKTDKGMIERSAYDEPATLPLTDSNGVSAATRRHRGPSQPTRKAGVNKARRRAIANK